MLTNLMSLQKGMRTSIKTPYKNMEDKMKKEYYRYLICIASYYEAACQNYFKTGVRTMIATNHKDKSKFYNDGHYRQDLVYKKIKCEVFS